MNGSRHLFFLMNHVFYGVGFAVIYGIVTGLFAWLINGHEAFTEYTKAFFISFNCAISGGLIVSAAILIFRFQSCIPDRIEEVFSPEDLAQTDYTEQRRRYFSAARSTAFATEFVVVGFGIFTIAEFPFDGFEQYALLAFACAQYGLGVYIGRKLFYIAQMLHAIDEINIQQDIFTEDRLGMISAFVNSLSMLTVIFVFIHVYGFYYAPFSYGTVLGETARIALLLPGIIALPVIVIFNFYPRTVLRSLYKRSIAYQTEVIKTNLVKSDVSEYERLALLIEYDKIWRDELQRRLRLTLSDLPIAITIAFMVARMIF